MSKQSERMTILTIFDTPNALSWMRDLGRDEIGAPHVPLSWIPLAWASTLETLLGKDVHIQRALSRAGNGTSHFLVMGPRPGRRKLRLLFCNEEHKIGYVIEHGEDHFPVEDGAGLGYAEIGRCSYCVAPINDDPVVWTSDQEYDVATL